MGIWGTLKCKCGIHKRYKVTSIGETNFSFGPWIMECERCGLLNLKKWLNMSYKKLSERNIMKAIITINTRLEWRFSSYNIWIGEKCASQDDFEKWITELEIKRNWLMTLVEGWEPSQGLPKKDRKGPEQV